MNICGRRKAIDRYCYTVCLMIFTASASYASILDKTRFDLAKVPKLSGNYRPESQHPNVLLTPAELQSIAKRTAISGSFSARMFSALTVRVRADLRAKIDWSGVYSGCDLYTYLHLFSFESMEGYPGQTRTEMELEQAAEVESGSQAPKGAAIVAARLALYASLVHAGAGGSGDVATATRAIEVAKQILNAWADRGFPRTNGKVSANTDQFCVEGKRDPHIEPTIGLQISRGMIYYVFAQDLLEGLNAFDAGKVGKISAFDTQLYALIINAYNLKFGTSTLWLKDCERYGNSNGSDLTALLGIARVLNDRRRFEAVIRGGDDAFPIALSWTANFNLAIYGKDDRPNACYENSGSSARTSHPSFDTSTVVAGEIDDRFRNANSLQSIGYSMFTLTHLFRAAEILVRAGYDPYGYHGIHGQSLETATELFACYGRTTGFDKIVDEKAKACPNFPQYDGAMVNGVETNVVIGAFRYSANSTLVGLNPAAEKVEATMVVDPLLFGLWQE